jgi:hypothetical protein
VDERWFERALAVECACFSGVGEEMIVLLGMKWN